MRRAWFAACGTAQRYGGWPAVVAWAALIFALSSIPSEVVGQPSRLPLDKVAHGGIYAVLGFLLALAVSHRRARLTLALAAAALAIAALYGISDEFHQAFVPGRDPDVHDWLADVAGAAVGVVVAAVVLRGALTPSPSPSGGEGSGTDVGC